MGQCCSICRTSREKESPPPLPDMEQHSFKNNAEGKRNYAEGQRNNRDVATNDAGRIVRRRTTHRKVRFSLESEPSPGAEPGRSEDAKAFRSEPQRRGRWSFVDHVSSSDFKPESRLQPLLESASLSDSEPKRIGRFLITTVSPQELKREKEQVGDPSVELTPCSK